jgi:Pilus formation protein N terminal region
MTWRCAGIASVCALAAMMPSVAAVATDTIDVVLDQAQIVHLPDRVGTIVVGNPLIADVTVQSGGLMVVTGKGYGRTNVIALDHRGAVLLEKAIQVQGPYNVVVIYRGVDRESYSCAPKCERRITLGDTKDYFDSTLNQTGSRTGQASGAGAAAGQK